MVIENISNLCGIILSKNKYTPTGYLNLWEAEDFMSVEFPSLEDVLAAGFIEETTYSAAFDKVGKLGQYKRQIDFFGIGDEKLYTVTPKGNGLVFLVSDGGKSVKKESGVKELKPVFGLPGIQV